ncbi:hypothetical protein [Sebaldella sp. S0638]|uniref:hypothetical protein n=1 Tax=Sebaldella sp. S0638 TaxID=2957809 RepID=UPI00209F5DDB|nr:hypothetical protein [Sebaldella sp. S0638]MCP1224092.1 hypothetical protein [Sebaldella sp. S0638]
MLLKINYKNIPDNRIIPTEAVIVMCKSGKEIILNLNGNKYIHIIYNDDKDVNEDFELIQSVWYLKEYEGKNFIFLKNHVHS